MDSTLLVTLSHQVAAQRAMDVISNNLANMSTNGYRREELKFEEYLQRSRPAEGQKGTQITSYVNQAGILRDTSEGRIEATSNPFDIAISGNGYFAIQTANGERYTRDGHFTLDSEGQIVTDRGDPVLSDGGPVTVTNEDGDIKIAADGTVSGEQGQLAKLRVVQFPDDRIPVKEGGSYYGAGGATPVDAEGGFKLSQGMLERSNVEPVTEMSNMINLMRSYQAITNLTAAQETMQLKAVSRLGSVPS
jgi:flagellar basal-body rod protein FlgF